MNQYSYQSMLEALENMKASEFVTVTLKFPTEKLDVVQQQPIYLANMVSSRHYDSRLDMTILMYKDVYYGELDGLDELAQAGVPYDYSWQQGMGFPAGNNYCRYTPEGNLQLLHVPDDMLQMDVQTLYTLSQHPDQLIRSIRERASKVIPLTWDNQVQYSQLFLSKQLICPQPIPTHPRFTSIPY